MHRSLIRGSLSALLVTVGMLFFAPGTVQAQPSLCGPWNGKLPAGDTMTLIFQPGEFVGHAVWRGPLTTLINGCVVSVGIWELRMFTGTEGTMGIQDGACIYNSVGNIDMGARVLIYKNVSFRP
jgi:hypothetical protein